MANIQPTQNFVLLQFRSKDGSVIYLPEGQRDPGGDIVVMAVGPDVPQNPPMPVGARVMLRGDSKLYGANEAERTVLVDSRWITAVIDDSTVPLLTDAEIDELSAAKN